MRVARNAKCCVPLCVYARSPSSRCGFHLSLLISLPCLHTCAIVAGMDPGPVNNDKEYAGKGGRGGGKSKNSDDVIYHI